MRTSKTASAFLLTVALLLTNVALADQRETPRFGDRDNALIRIIKIIKRLVVAFDEPQGPPPAAR